MPRCTLRIACVPDDVSAAMLAAALREHYVTSKHLRVCADEGVAFATVPQSHAARVLTGLCVGGRVLPVRETRNAAAARGDGSATPAEELSRDRADWRESDDERDLIAASGSCVACAHDDTVMFSLEGTTRYICSTRCLQRWTGAAS